MSNRIVPATYRAIIDDVMTNIRDHFQEFGVDDEVLQSLQNKWEQKVVESNVADFEPAGPAPSTPNIPTQQLQSNTPSNPSQYNLAVPQARTQVFPNHIPNASTPNHTAYGSSPVKAEPNDQPSYQLPSINQVVAQNIQRAMLIGPNGQPQPPFTAAQLQHVMQHQVTAQQLQAFQIQQAQMQRQMMQNAQQPQQKPSPGQLQAASRLPQVDGPSSWVPEVVRFTIPQLDGTGSSASSSSDRSSASPPPSTLQNPASTVASTAPAEEEIGSDLDDDDSDAGGEDGNAGANAVDGAGPGDIVYCTYDKVQRVKNKWKCVLKDGIVSVDGKDYLFSKCTGEFEW